MHLSQIHLRLIILLATQRYSSVCKKNSLLPQCNHDFSCALVPIPSLLADRKNWKMEKRVKKNCSMSQSQVNSQKATNHRIAKYIVSS